MLRPALLAAALALAVLHLVPGPSVTLVSAAGLALGMGAQMLPGMSKDAKKAAKKELKAMNPDMYRAAKLAKLADPAKMQKYMDKKALKKAGMTNVRKMAKKYEKQVKLNAMSPAAQQAALAYKAAKKNLKKGALGLAAAGGAVLGAGMNAYQQQRAGPNGMLPPGMTGGPPPNMNVVGVPPPGNIHAQSRDGPPPTNTGGPPPNMDEQPQQGNVNVQSMDNPDANPNTNNPDANANTENPDANPNPDNPDANSNPENTGEQPAGADG
jgi:hypothetical protein